MATNNPVTDKRTKIRPFILMQPLVVFDLVVDIHKKVKQYLEASFYNLTTIALHDWLTYSEMKNLAKEKVRIVYQPPPNRFASNVPLRSTALSSQTTSCPWEVSTRV